MPPPRSINIGPYSFPLTPGYSDGTFAITPNELEALDLLRSERVRKKAFKVMEKMRARSGRRTLSEHELAHLTAQVAGFDRDVRLERTEVGKGGAPRTVLAAPLPDNSDGVFADELRRLAEARLDAEERARGLTVTDREAALRTLSEEPLLREAARLRVEVVLAERDRMVEELF